MMLVMAVLALGQVPHDDKGAIEGKVVNIRGEPLRKADLQLRAMRPGFQALTASTDNEGNFAFQGLDPSIYLLSASRAGYLGQSYGTRTPGLLGNGLDIHAAARISELIIAMTPQGDSNPPTRNVISQNLHRIAIRAPGSLRIEAGQGTPRIQGKATNPSQPRLDRKKINGDLRRAVRFRLAARFLLLVAAYRATSTARILPVL